MKLKKKDIKANYKVQVTLNITEPTCKLCHEELSKMFWSHICKGTYLTPVMPKR